MKVDITGYGNVFSVRNSETQEELNVKSLGLYLNSNGMCEATLYVEVARLDLRGVKRGADGVRETTPTPGAEGMQPGVRD